MKRPASDPTLPSTPARPRTALGRGIAPARGALVAAALSASLLAGAARADTPSDKIAAAEALFQEARALSAKGDHAAACPKFKASHELDPGYGVLFNLAECYAAVGKTASAWAAYNEAAGMAKVSGQADRVEKADKRAAELTPKLEKLTVVVSDPPSGLVVKRDGVVQAAATWGVALPVDPGSHTIVAEAPGKKPWTGEVATGGPGKTVSITIPALEDAPAGSSTSPTSTGTSDTGGPPPGDDGLGARRIAGLAIGGAGIVAIVVGSAMGGLASSSWNDAQNNHCRTELLCDPIGVGLVRDAKTFATVSTALFIGGGVLAAGGATLFVLSLGGGKKEGAGLTVTPSAGPGSAGVLLSGRFH